MQRFFAVTTATLLLTLQMTPTLVRADDYAPSYASSANHIAGRVASFDGAYELEVRDDRGDVDDVHLHQGTIINPTGLTLEPGMVVSILGEDDGDYFSADEIDSPYISEDGGWYYQGHPWNYFGYGVALGFFFGSIGWWYGGHGFYHGYHGWGYGGQHWNSYGNGYWARGGGYGGGYGRGNYGRGTAGYNGGYGWRRGSYTTNNTVIVNHFNGYNGSRGGSAYRQTQYGSAGRGSYVHSQSYAGGSNFHSGGYSHAGGGYSHSGGYSHGGGGFSHGGSSHGSSSHGGGGGSHSR